MINRLRFGLIRLLAGRDAILLNVDIAPGSIAPSKGARAMLSRHVSVALA